MNCLVCHLKVPRVVLALRQILEGLGHEDVVTLFDQQVEQAQHQGRRSAASALWLSTVGVSDWARIGEGWSGTWASLYTGICEHQQFGPREVSMLLEVNRAVWEMTFLPTASGLVIAATKVQEPKESWDACIGSLERGSENSQTQESRLKGTGVGCVPPAALQLHGLTMPDIEHKMKGFVLPFINYKSGGEM